MARASFSFSKQKSEAFGYVARSIIRVTLRAESGESFDTTALLDSGADISMFSPSMAADILEIAKAGSRKTKIMYLGNLSFDLLQKYLDMLVKYDLLGVHDRPDKSCIATEKDKQFLPDYYELQKYSQIVDSKKRALQAGMALKA